jgi:hypothetical protein
VAALLLLCLPEPEPREDDMTGISMSAEYETVVYLKESRIRDYVNL